MAEVNGVRLWNRDDLVRALLESADDGLGPAAQAAI